MDILIIRLSALGDIIHCLPAAAYIKRAIPGARITWLVEPAGAPLLEGNPAVDQVVVMPRKAWLKGLKNPLLWAGTACDIGRFFQALRERKFQATVDFQGLLKSAVPAFASGASRRFGFAGTREGADRLLSDPLDVGDYFAPDVHVVELNLKLARHMCHLATGDLGGASPKAGNLADLVEFPLPPVTADSKTRLDDMLKASLSSGLAPPKIAALIPGTTWISKIWPAPSWSELGRLLTQELGYSLVLIGGPLEADTNSFIAERLKALAPEFLLSDLTGRTSLMELVALFERCDLVVGADTGPLHLAAATGVARIVGIYGSTPIKRNGPYGAQCHCVALNLPCQPCFARVCPLSTTACLMDLTPQKVFEEICRLPDRV